MHTAIRVVSASSTEPISVSAAKTHLRITHSSDDTYIGTLITAARGSCERFTGRSLIPKTCQLLLDGFPDDDVIEIPGPPLTGVTAGITYYDSNNELQTLPSSSYVIDIYSEPGRVVLADGCTWPTTYNRPNAVTIQFTCGYSSVPAELQQAMLILIAHWYEHREPIITGTIVSSVPLSAKDLMYQYQIRGVP